MNPRECRHIYKTSPPKAVDQLARHPKFTESILSNTFCCNYVTYLLEAGYDIRLVQELPGYKGMKMKVFL